jgi:putative transposase
MPPFRAPRSGATLRQNGPIRKGFLRQAREVLTCSPQDPSVDMRVRQQETDDAEQPFQRGADHRVLREQESGATTAAVCRRHGISEQTFYRWKAQYGGMGPSNVQRLKSLEDENRRLKKLLAESMLDVAALKDLLAKTELACGVA